MAVDGSKFKAVNNRDRNFTAAKMKRRMAPDCRPEDGVGHDKRECKQNERQDRYKRN